MKKRTMKNIALVGLMLVVPGLASANFTVNWNMSGDFWGEPGEDFTGNLGAAPDLPANTFWNQNPMPTNTTLTASDGVTVTSVGYEFPGGWPWNDVAWDAGLGDPSLDIFQRGWGGEQDAAASSMDIFGLDDAYEHDLYIYSNLIHPNPIVSLRGGQFTVGGTTLIATSLEGDSFIEGVNYVKFSNLTPSGGTITVSLENYDTGDINAWVVNGFQIVQIPEPSTLALAAAGVLALCVARARRR
jgi:hypothetical protein